MARQSLPGSRIGNCVLFLYRHGEIVHDGIFARGVFHTAAMRPHLNRNFLADTLRKFLQADFIPAFEMGDLQFCGLNCSGVAWTVRTRLDSIRRPANDGCRR